VFNKHKTSEIAPKPLKAWLHREGYRYRDEGIIVIENETAEAVPVDIYCKEQFVHFPKRRYMVLGQLQVPFSIKLPPLQSAQLMFRKIPSLSAKIELVALYNKALIKKNLRLTAGEW